MCKAAPGSFHWIVRKLKQIYEFSTKVYGVWILINKKQCHTISARFWGVTCSMKIKRKKGKVKATYMYKGLGMERLRNFRLLKTGHRFYGPYSWVKVLNFCRNCTCKAICLHLIPRASRHQWLPSGIKVQYLLYNTWATSCLRNLYIRLIKIFNF